MSETAKPKKDWIFYPLLFAMFPVLSLYSANLALVPYTQVIRPLLVVTLATGVVWSLLALVLRSWHKGAVATTVSLASTFLYSKVLPVWTTLDIPPIWRGWAYGLSSLLICALLVWKWRAHGLLNFLSVAALVVVFGQIGWGLQKAASQRSQLATNSVKAAATKSDRPDIIYIILDGYGRSDALKRAMGFSNQPFIDGLESRGFYVAKDSRANYCQTELSVASSLNMDSLQALVPPTAMAEQDRSVLSTLTNRSRVVSYLHDLGYVFASITSSFPPLQFEESDVNLNSKTGFSLLETALIQMTPINNQMVSRSMFDRHRQWTLDSFEAIEALGQTSAVPRFVVAHILAPHPPFVFAANGENAPNQNPYGFWDGTDYLEYVGNAEKYRVGYTGQAEYIGKRVLTAIDALLAKRKVKPIIIIQGDHGSKMRLDQLELQRTDVNECFPNLNAYLVPDSVRSKLYPGVTPMNSFRLVFNGLFGDSLPLLPDQSWYSNYPKPFDFTDVTAQIVGPEKMANLPQPTFKPRFP